MHRVKGLEFDHVIVVAANAAIVPLEVALASADDQTSGTPCRDRRAGVLYVALTRAKKSALITAYGEVSPYLATSGRPFPAAH